MAEILGQNRILLLGKPAWEILPFLEATAHAESKTTPIHAVAKSNGVYDFSSQSLNLKLLFVGKYVDHLKQAVCIIGNVSVELKAEGAMMTLHKEIAELKTRLKESAQEA